LKFPPFRWVDVMVQEDEELNRFRRVEPLPPALTIAPDCRFTLLDCRFTLAETPDRGSQQG